MYKVEVDLAVQRANTKELEAEAVSVGAWHRTRLAVFTLFSRISFPARVQTPGCVCAGKRGAFSAIFSAGNVEFRLLPG